MASNGFEHFMHNYYWLNGWAWLSFFNVVERSLLSCKLSLLIDLMHPC